MEEHSFVPLLVVVAAAMVTGIVLPRLKFIRVPVVVGEILAGIVLGKSGIHLIPDEPDPWLELLSLFGFTFLMFLSGLEIDLRSLRVDAGGGDEEGDGRNLRQLLVVTFSVFFATLVLSLLLSIALVWLDYLESPYIMALIMSTTSVGLVMPLLKERAEADTPFGQILILSAVVADFATMLLITVVVAFYGREGLTLDVLVIGTLFLVFFAVLILGRRLLRYQGALVKHLAFTAPKTAELSVRVAMTMMLAFVVISQFVGAEIILGAFLAGALVSNLTKSAHGLLGMKLDAIGFGIFIPVFFIMVGARFDIMSLLGDPASLFLVPLLVIFAFVVKVVPSLLLSRFFGRRNAVAAGFLISSRLSLIIAASAIGLRLGVITPEINTAIIMVAIITCVASPAIYSHIRGTASGKKEGKKVQLEPLLGHVMARPSAEGLKLELVEVDVSSFGFMLGNTLAESRLRQRTGMTLIAVTRRDGSIVDNPPGDFRLERGDALFLVGNPEQVTKMQQLAGEPPESDSECGGLKDETSATPRPCVAPLDQPPDRC